MKKLLTIVAIALMAIGFTTFNAKAESVVDMTAGEELSVNTDAMSTEAEAEFNADVACKEIAMEGEEPGENCVSAMEEDVDVDVDTKSLMDSEVQIEVEENIE